MRSTPTSFGCPASAAATWRASRLMWPARGGRRRRLRHCSVPWRTGARCGSSRSSGAALVRAGLAPAGVRARRAAATRFTGGRWGPVRIPAARTVSDLMRAGSARGAVCAAAESGRRPPTDLMRRPPRAAPGRHPWIKGWRPRSARGGRSSCWWPRRSRRARWSACASRWLPPPDAAGAGRRSSDRPAAAARRRSVREPPPPQGDRLPGSRRSSDGIAGLAMLGRSAAAPLPVEMATQVVVLRSVAAGERLTADALARRGCRPATPGRRGRRPPGRARAAGCRRASGGRTPHGGRARERHGPRRRA